jgi:hypothetical protein
MADPSLIAKPNMEYAKPAQAGGKKGRGLGILTFIAFLFFMIVGLVYGGIFFYKRSLEQSLDGLTRELSQLEEDLDSEIINEIARVDRGLATARSLLAQHVYTSNLFNILGDNTLDSVYYTDFTYNFSHGGTAVLTGIADGYVSLHRQIEQLRSVPLVTNATLESIQLAGENDIGFIINVLLNENVFRFR